MKRIVISTFGSFGDLHPYLAIALELKRRGHQPIIATSNLYREKVSALELELHPVRPDLPSYDRPDEVSRMADEFMDAKQGSVRIFKWLMLHVGDAYQDLLAGTRGADLLLTHPLPFVGPVVAEVAGIPWVSSVLSPFSLFSVSDPGVPPQLPVLHEVLKRSQNLTRVFYQIARWRIRKLTVPVQELRARVGLAPGKNPLLEGQHSPEMVLALFSSAFSKPQADWPANTRVTGFCFYDRRDREGDTPGLEPELKKFLDAGPPPIIFTLGSTAFWIAKDFYRESIEAVRAVGRRALLLIGDERNRPAGALPEGVAAFEYAPFGELLPLGCVTVHHGGVGSTGQGMRAGRPALVVPFSHDQFDNGMRLARANCGRVLAHSKYNARSAARELSQLLGDSRYASSAAAVGKIIQAEDGARAACDALEEVLHS
jgi:UDP:flavonoid glycosyltransferase YjiC (YdhE family)